MKSAFWSRSNFSDSGTPSPTMLCPPTMEESSDTRLVFFLFGHTA